MKVLADVILSKFFCSLAPPDVSFVQLMIPLLFVRFAGCEVDADCRAVS